MEFKNKDYIIYVNGDSYELGRIKRITEDGAFVAYHEGETGAKTPFDKMHSPPCSTTLFSNPHTRAAFPHNCRSS